MLFHIKYMRSYIAVQVVTFLITYYEITQEQDAVI